MSARGRSAGGGSQSDPRASFSLGEAMILRERERMLHRDRQESGRLREAFQGCHGLRNNRAIALVDSVFPEEGQAMGAPEGTAAYAYATALRKALDGYLAGGGTQAAIAKALSTSTASVSRYLSGERIAPREKLHALKAYLEAQCLPFPDGVWAELDELCGKAHLASGAAAVQRDHLKEELARACAEHQRAQWIAKQQLHGLEQRADRLTEDLRRALARAQLAERTSRILQERVTVQDRSMRKAGDYIRTIEGELAQQKEQAGPLLTEVGVLREQNRRLVEEKPAVAAPAPQLSHPHTPHYVYIPLPPSPTLETAAATAEPVEAANPPQWVPPQEPPNAGPAGPYATAPLPQQDRVRRRGHPARPARLPGRGDHAPRAPTRRVRLRSLGGCPLRHKHL